MKNDIVSKKLKQNRQETAITMTAQQLIRHQNYFTSGY